MAKKNLVAAIEKFGERAAETLLPVPTAAFFAVATRLRGRRFFHPYGRAFAGTLHIPKERAALKEGDHQAIARLSRGAGVPQGLPDVLGLAIKLPDYNGPRRDQDFLLVSAASAPVARHLLLPASEFGSRTFSTVLPYEVDGEVLLFGTLPSPPEERVTGLDLAKLDEALEQGRLRFRFAVARLTGAWRRIGNLQLERRLSQELSDELRFNPWNTSDRIRPIGPLNRLRADAYPASQEARESPNAN
ncbi:MAG TPA: hypothetical protein VHI54_02680 [Actinomycetota bacterium]|nr:hypothetical protein [Actinomycetota bacterium]